MNKGVAADVFETLGGIVKGTGQQAVSDAKKMGEETAIELGLKTPAQGAADDSKKQDQAKEEQIKKMGEAAKQKSTARYKQIQEEIKRLQEKRKQEIPKQVSGKPGFDEGKMVKQLETGKPEGEKKKLPPVNVQRERTKAERFRGVSG